MASTARPRAGIHLPEVSEHVSVPPLEQRISRSHMSRVFTWSMISAGILIAAVSPVQAVELVSRDKVPRDVTVNRADGSSDTITVKPGEKVADVCEECIVLLGTTSVEAKGKDTVRIEGGKVSIRSQH